VGRSQIRAIANQACSEHAIGVQVLQKIEKDGVPLLAEFGKYARKNAGAAFLNVKPASYAGNHIANWLIQGGHLDQCSLLAKALTDAPEAVRASMLFYFVKAKCVEDGTALSLSLLVAKEEYQRAQACWVLGEIGGPSVVKKLRILAESDSAFGVTEARGNDGRIYATKVFPVRDACGDAASRIQLRSPKK